MTKQIINEKITKTDYWNERMGFGPAICSWTHPPVSWPATLWSLLHGILWQQLTVFSNEYYQVLIATHLPTQPLTRKPEQQQFTMPSGILTSISSSHRSAIAATHCSNKQTLDPQFAARLTHLCRSQPLYGLNAMFSGNDSLFLVASIIVLIASHLHI